MCAIARPRPARPFAVTLTALLVCACAGPRRADSPSPPSVAERRAFPVLEHGGLEIEVPADWTVQVFELERGTPASIRLDAPGGGALFIAPVYNPDPPVGAPGLETARAFAELALEKAIPMATGPAPVLWELNGTDGVLRGYWFLATDKDYAPPEPGHERWRNMIRGAVAVGRLIISFTWFDDWPGPGRSQALAVMVDARHAQGEPGKPSQ